MLSEEDVFGGHEIAIRVQFNIARDGVDNDLGIISSGDTNLDSVCPVIDDDYVLDINFGLDFQSFVGLLVKFHI